MLENLKADVIYHCSNSDFEMEFNLCGCCRMRLLSDKTSDKKGLINALAKAVSRSRVIMVCGPLFNDDGLIKIVAAATGKGTEKINGSEYGINGGAQIEIMKGSVPLITTDGYFGGCIIESGPQTIILLTENRTFRKDIMKNLVHPYVEQISVMPISNVKAAVPQEMPKAKEAEQEQTPAPTNKPQPQQPPQEAEESVEFITEPEVEAPSEEAAPTLETDTEHNIEFVMESDDEIEDDGEVDSPVVDDEIYNDMCIEPESIKSIKSSYEHDYSTSNNDNGYILEDENDIDEDEDEMQPKPFSNLPLIILTILLLGAVLTLCYFIFLKPYLMGVSTAEYITEIFSAASNMSHGA